MVQELWQDRVRKLSKLCAVLSHSLINQEEKIYIVVCLWGRYPKLLWITDAQGTNCSVPL